MDGNKTQENTLPQEHNKTPLSEEDIIDILKSKYHDFERLVGRKMTYAEERDYGEARDTCG
jgi:hypothetical protein